MAPRSPADATDRRKPTHDRTRWMDAPGHQGRSMSRLLDCFPSDQLIHDDAERSRRCNRRRLIGSFVPAGVGGAWFVVAAACGGPWWRRRHQGPADRGGIAVAVDLLGGGDEASEFTDAERT